MHRLSDAEALLGPELFGKVRDTPILVVGAGGIGCELLKNLVLTGFTNIELIDLDTIDLSNLNRQFLFRKPDIGKSKSLVAAATARHFNPSSGVNINARHGNVKDADNDLKWISQFGLVMNALDNADARRHVNKLCCAANVPLIESGTAGYLGQVTPIIPNVTECYDCNPKPPPKSFPVCTIRATPSEPIHCIVWGKSYLFGKLFGEDDEAGDEAELDKAKAEGENAEEIENLKTEAATFREVRRMLSEENRPQEVFRKVFFDDINRSLQMEDMWNRPGRIKPVALDYDAIVDGSFVAPPPRTPAQTGAAAANGNASASTSKSTLKDQQELSLKDNLELFISACERLAARAKAQPNIVLSFDKDDDDTLDFVVAVANLRATAYSIGTRTRFQVKEMAGNIIPAIATTNAVIAGFIVMQALALLKKKQSESKCVYLWSVPARPLGASAPVAPVETCAVCRDTYIPFKVDATRSTLGEFIEGATAWLADSLGENADDFACTVLEGGRVLADPDFDDNHSRTLADLSIERGKMITLIDEDDTYRPIHFCVLELDKDETAAEGGPNETAMVFGVENVPPPTLALKPAPKPVVESRESSEEIEITDQAPSRKRSGPDDEDADGQPVKKRKMSSGKRDEPVTVEDDDDDDVIIVE